MNGPVEIVGMDHIVLNVSDVERSLAFYGGTLGLAPVRVEEWREGKAPFPSVRVDTHTIIDLLAAPRTGQNTDHFCLVVRPTDFGAVVDSGRFDVADGPGPRFGARGVGTSLYVRDPDGNGVELRYYSG
jgi:catechol 2,3-dioxygenase-like lactoylglutathione lyase family enzyme